MDKNKTGKYIKYALGEILLVMIGILLALQVNNWNEERKDRIQEQLILKQLSEEFRSNLIQIESKIQFREVIIEAANQLLFYFDNPAKMDVDSLIAKISVLTITPTFDPITNNLISSGNLQLIKNRELNQLLAEWPTYVTQLKELEDEYVTNYRNILLPFIINSGVGRNVDHAFWENEENLLFLLDKKGIKDKPTSGKSIGAIDFNGLLEGKKLEGMVSNAIYINYIGNLESKGVEKRILQILEYIEKEIK